MYGGMTTMNIRLEGGPYDGRSHSWTGPPTYEIHVPMPGMMNMRCYSETDDIPIDFIPMPEMIYRVDLSHERAQFEKYQSGLCGCGEKCANIDDWPAHMYVEHCNETLFQVERDRRIHALIANRYKKAAV